MDRSDLVEFDLLRSLVAVVDAASMTEAASRLSLTQPAISKHIGALEKRYGARLLHRDGRGVSPTAIGELLVRRARIILRQLDALEAGQAFCDTSRVVRVALMPTVADLIVVPLVQTLGRKEPDLQLRVSEGFSGHTAEWLREGLADVAICYTTANMTGLTVAATFTDTLHLVVPASLRLPPDGRLRPAELEKLDFVLPGEPHGLRQLADQLGASFGFKLRVTYEIASFGLMRRLVTEGLAATFLPWNAIADDVRAGRVKLATVDGVQTARSMSVVTSPSRPVTPDMQLAMDELCALLDKRLGDAARDRARTISKLSEPLALLDELAGSRHA
jgi:LysR family nitrogen assimilation transcriptional regulator